MSFGIGLGDIALLVNLSWSLYKKVKDSSEDFRQMTNEVMSLNAIVSEMKEFMEQEGDDLEPWRRDRLNHLIECCMEPLRELEQLYDKYDSLDTRSQRTWDRLHFGLKNLAPIRQRLVSSTTMLGSFNTIMIHSSTSRIHLKMNKFIAEVQAGKREGSIVSMPDAVATIDTPDGWDHFRRELEDIGISAAILEERRDYIVAIIRTAIAEGRLDEILDDRTLTPTGESDRDSSWYHTAPDTDPDFRDAGSDASSYTAVNSQISLTAASEAFEAEVREQQSQRNIAELLNPVAAANEYSLNTQGKRPTPRRRSTADAVGLVKRLFQKQTALIQAASDGDLDRVAKLLSMGMNVDTRDRWGWTALSMAGYGGYPAIARLLLDHGADLNNEDVDKDTPMSLALQRGHTDVVIMFEQEMVKREREAQQAEVGASSRA
uniref:Ankyrin repeat protein n=1 Tax=Mycena chlorophos TaxID=658473 RepID=A0ABQ0MBX2_MYCCL|nr:predicted protein [Mycena chlorophos]